MIELRTDWTFGTATYPAGSLLAANYDEFLAGDSELSVVFEPDAHTCLHQYAWTRDRLLLVTLADVASRVEIVTPAAGSAPRWRASRRQPTRVIVAADDTGDEFFLDSSGFDSPSRLLRGTGSRTARADQVRARHSSTPKTSPSHNISRRRKTAPRSRTSLCGPGDAEGPGPTLLCGYGGFENSYTPGYSPVLGRLWLARGGTYVLANIRGGGEYGPRWHTQAMREGRHMVDEDFAAVATDLVDRGITKVPQLGAQGGSNGGLLMGIMLTKYPEMFGALVCQVPLLDMRRFHLLLAGASWVAEYGDPDDPADWKFIAEYSPYQNISAERRLPAGADHHVHPRRSRASRACPQDDRCIGGGGPPGLVLREHRGRPRRRGRQRAELRSRRR